MTHSSKARRSVAVLTVTALGALTSWTSVAGAHTALTATGITPGPQHAVVVDDTIRINMRPGTQVTTTRLTVGEGGHTAWHYHPGPHVVAVTAGEVKVFETDCTVRGTFAAGGGFFDPGSARPRRVHTLYNPPGNGPAELVITDFREEGQLLTVPVSPQPVDCF